MARNARQNSSSAVKNPTRIQMVENASPNGGSATTIGIVKVGRMKLIVVS